MNTKAITKCPSTSPHKSGTVAQVADASVGFRRQLAGVALIVAAALAFWPRLPGLAQQLRGGPAATRVVAAPLGAGERLSLAIRVDGAASLAAFEAALRFDPAIARPISTRLGSFAPSGSTLLEDQAGSAGRLAVGSYNAMGQSASGGGVLALVTFEALAAGPVELSLDPGATAAFDALGQPLSATISLAASSESIYLPRVSSRP